MSYLILAGLVHSVDASLENRNKIRDIVEEILRKELNLDANGGISVSVSEFLTDINENQG